MRGVRKGPSGYFILDSCVKRISPKKIPPIVQQWARGQLRRSPRAIPMNLAGNSDVGLRQLVGSVFPATTALSVQARPLHPQPNCECTVCRKGKRHAARGRRCHQIRRPRACRRTWSHSSAQRPHGQPLRTPTRRTGVASAGAPWPPPPPQPWQIKIKIYASLSPLRRRSWRAARPAAASGLDHRGATRRAALPALALSG